MIIKCNVDRKSFTSKPVGSEIGDIQNRLAKGQEEIEISELASLLACGASFKPAHLESKDSSSWVSQQLFALDFDNDITKNTKITTIEAELTRATKVNVHPAFGYTTFRHSEALHKFRLVFALDVAITDIRIRNTIQFALLRLFPNADQVCKDSARLFFGGRELICSNYDSVVNPYELIQNMIATIKSENLAPKATKATKAFCQETGLNMINGLPDVRFIEDVENGNLTCRPILYIYRCEGEISKNIAFNFFIKKEDIITTDSATKKKNSKYGIPTNTKEKTTTTQRFDFEELRDNCELYRSFVEGSRWAYHQEVFGMATNLSNVEGGEKRLLEALQNASYDSNRNNLEHTVKSSKSYNYEPTRCNNFCPFASECEHNLNMLQQVENKQRSIRQITEATQTITLAEAEKKTYEEILIAFNNTNKDIVNVIKSPTGIGKSYMLQEIAKTDPDFFTNTIVAFPTHKLLKEQVAKIIQYLPHLLYMNEAEIEDKKLRTVVKTAQTVGNYEGVRLLLKGHIKTLEASRTTENTVSVDRQIKSINSYLESSTIAKTTDRPIFCTHKRLTILRNTHVKRIIVDEDLVNTLAQTITVDVKELKISLNYANSMILSKFYDLTTIQSHIIMLIEFFEKVAKTQNVVTEYPHQLFVVPDASEVKNFLLSCTPNFNLIDLLNIKAATCNGEVITAVINNIDNIQDVPMTILSATANETVYKTLLKRKTIKFTNIDNVETKGQVIIHTNGNSRSYLTKNFDKTIARIKEESPNIKNVITFAKFEEKFEKQGFTPIAHYGATAGLDVYKGQDLIVFGTPHMNISAYLILAHMCGIKKGIKTEMDVVSCNRNGFEFSFSTYNNDDTSEEAKLLREIQFYLIEAELIQSIGRARVLRENCTVHVYSNLPIHGCKIYKK
jgi:hypothetical protein